MLELPAVAAPDADRVVGIQHRIGAAIADRVRGDVETQPIGARDVADHAFLVQNRIPNGNGARV